MRRSRIPPINPERRAAKYKRNFSGPFDDYDHSKEIVKLECAAAQHPRYHRPITPAHAVARGMGGVKGRWSDLVPLCKGCHAIFDVECAGDIGRFLQRFGVDLRELADVLAVKAWAENASAEQQEDPPDYIEEARQRLVA